MKLYLVQNGLALTKEENSRRPLSQEGHDETEKIAEFSQAININVYVLWHSPKLRARQTAQIISDYLNCSKIQERKDLNPLDPITTFPKEIQTLNKDLMIVGHLPFLERLASLLLARIDSKPVISFKNSGVICLEYLDTWKAALKIGNMMM